MKKLLTILAATFGLLLIGQASELVNKSGASNIAINGYDPVAFFTVKKPTHGSPSITAKYQEVIYLFATEENKKAFEASPSKYAPQYGGFCAYGASVGALFPIDISTWQVIDEKLYFNLNPAINKIFNKDLKANLKNAEVKWVELQKKQTAMEKAAK